MSEVAIVDVAADHPAFDGHFPGRPILPGVVILAEVMAAIERTGRPCDGCTLRLAKFLSPVQPGDRLRITLEARGDAIDFVVATADRRVATGTVLIDAGPPA